jgi:hypothetical protein
MTENQWEPSDSKLGPRAQALIVAVNRVGAFAQVGETLRLRAMGLAKTTEEE